MDARNSLERVLERSDAAAALDQRVRLVRRGHGRVALADGPGHAARVVRERLARAEVYLEVGKGPRGDAGAAADGVAAQARGVAVEERRGGRVGGVAVPVPVRVGAGVAALVAQGALVREDEVAVPREEVGRVVDRVRLLDVHGDEVVEAAARAGDLARRRLGRRGLQALDGGDVRLALRHRQVGPLPADGRRLKGAAAAGGLLLQVALELADACVAELVHDIGWVGSCYAR